jgi:hypothetical protein
MDVQGSPRHDESARPTIRRESGALLCILLFLGRIWESRSLGVYGPRYRCNAPTTNRLLGLLVAPTLVNPLRLTSYEGLLQTMLSGPPSESTFGFN